MIIKIFEGAKVGGMEKYDERHDFAHGELVVVISLHEVVVAEVFEVG